MAKQELKVINNGVEIPDKCKCMWCGSEMRSGGARYFGAGVNQFALWCDNCGAIVIHAKDFGKKITGFSVNYETEKM